MQLPEAEVVEAVLSGQGWCDVGQHWSDMTGATPADLNLLGCDDCYVAYFEYHDDKKPDVIAWLPIRRAQLAAAR